LEKKIMNVRPSYRILVILLIAILLIPLSASAKKKKKAEETGPLFPENGGNLRYSITVSKFENKAGWRGQWDLGDGFGEIMTQALHESGWFIVLGETDMRNEAMAEQDFAASGRAAGGKKAPKIGRMTPAQLLVKGAITHVQSNTGGGGATINIKGFTIGGSKDKSEVNMTLYMVNSETGQVVASTQVTGKAKGRGVRLGYHNSGVGGNVGGYKNDNVGLACEDAVIQAVNYMIGQLGEVIWEGTIMIASGDKIVINRGSREGVSVGAQFNVGEVERLVDPDTGEVLDEEMTTVATMEVTQVKEKISYCKAILGADRIAKGMTIHPAR
jgi:curli biogenesis system outer membrane secretion channel CsgG